MDTRTTPHLMQLTTRPDVVMTRAEGSFLWDAQGRRYLDLVQGWAVNCLGHNPAVVIEAALAQMRSVLNVGPAYHNAPSHRLAERLCTLSGFDRVFFSCTGAEANETAVKLARKWGQGHKRGAFEVITTIDGFHGRTMAMTCATGKPGWDTAFPPAVPGFHKVPFGDIAALEAAIGSDTVAVMFEPLQGEAGVVVPPSDYLREVRALCDRHGILWIADEIQTGIARTGPLFAHQEHGLQADIMTLGKGVGAGLPLSATLCSERVACFERGDHGGTFAAHSTLCAVGLAVVEAIVQPEAESRRRRVMEKLTSSLDRLAVKHGMSRRGRGFLHGLVLTEARAEQVRDRALELGLLINAARPNVLRLMPALNLEEDHVDLLHRLLDGALT